MQGSGGIEVGASPLTRAVWWLGYPVGGGLAALAMTVGGDWLGSIPFLPWMFHASEAWLDSIVGRIPGDLPTTVVATGVGTLAGLGLGAYSHHRTPTVTVDHDGLRLVSEDADSWVDRADVHTVFVDDEEVVILGHRSEIVALGSSEDLQVPALAEALTHHGYRWHDGDPHAHEYRRWVPGLPELPAGADAIFAVRQEALEEEDQDELDSLRGELAKIGVIVRDDDEHQHWRLTRPAG